LKNSVGISALAITLNEARRVEKYINSLWFADEIIIVDSFSDDDTVALASQFENVKVYQREFDNFSSQKNFALSKAKNDWVTFFDLDEEVTESLAREVVEIFHSSEKAIAYSVRRNLIFMGKKLRYSGFQTDWVVRFFNKEHCRYDNLVHETLIVDGKTKKLKNRLPHHTYTGFDNYTKKLHQYSALQAKMLYQRKKRPNLYHFLFRPFYRFWHQYIIRLGILDGKEGFILAYINAFSVFKRYVNLWLLYRKID
jgi:glycosyltransferase involved in cell wall biosynthesis